MAPSHLHRIAFLVCCVVSSLAGAAVSVGPVFSDHMVIQRGMDVPVWGEAKAGERVTVEFLGKKLTAAWEVCSPKTVGDFSAVGYFFGREIHQREQAPIGLINNSWGGMPAESFTSAEALAADPDFAPILERKKMPTTEAVARAKQS